MAAHQTPGREALPGDTSVRPAAESNGVDAAPASRLVPDPGSILWQRGSDARVMLAAGYALLLQVAHPTVGAGVTEHSDFRRDPWGRLLRTLDFTCTMVYGGPEAASAMGRHIRRMHVGIKGTKPDGTPYSALEPDAYAWVHATLAEGIIAAHARFGRPFSADERELLWAQWRALGALLGIRDEQLPPDWHAFGPYFDAMTRETLERTTAVEEVLAVLARPVPPPVAALYRPLWQLARMPVGHLIGLSSAGLLPPALRERLGVPWGRRRELELGAASVALRAATPVIPEALRITGPGYLEWRSSPAA